MGRSKLQETSLTEANRTVLLLAVELFGAWEETCTVITKIT